MHITLQYKSLRNEWNRYSLFCCIYGIQMGHCLGENRDAVDSNNTGLSSAGTFTGRFFFYSINTYTIAIHCQGLARSMHRELWIQRNHIYRLCYVDYYMWIFNCTEAWHPSPHTGQGSRVLWTRNRHFQGNTHMAECCSNMRGTAGWGHLTVTAREGHHPRLKPDKSGKPERHTGNLRLAQIIKNVLITYQVLVLF